MAEENSSVKRVKLGNGLTVILEPNHSSPVAAINVWAKVGSACEGEDERGLAHFHEHMLFKGTADMDPGELAFEVESAGGRINAYTSFDQTVYHITVASRSLDRSIDLLAGSITESVFDPDEIRKEIEVVLEEIRRDKDSPESVLSRRLFSSAYKGHPYGYPILGTGKSVSSFTRDKVMGFYRKWYSPRNMVVVITGDFEEREVLARVKKRFGSLKKRDVPACTSASAPAPAFPAVSVLKRDVQEGYFALAFRIPGIHGEDVPALDIISEIMGEGESSRLFRVVKEEKGIVNSIYSYAYTPRMDGIFVVGGALNPENTNAAYREILEMFYKLAVSPPSSSDIEMAKLNIRSDSVRSKETMQGRAAALGFNEAIAGDYEFEKLYMEKVASVSADEISRVAAKYFVPSNLTAVALVPESSDFNAKLLKKAILSVNPEAAPSGGNSEPEIHKLKNGIRVIIKENNSIPLFAARLLLPGGLRFEDGKTNGLSNFAANMLTRGTSTRSSKQIAREIESMAGYIDGFSGRDSAGLSMEALSSNFDSAMEIFSDVALNPSFSEEEMTRAKREILAAINRKKDNLSGMSINRFLAALFKGSPYAREVEGSAANVKRFSRSEVADFYSGLLDPENMVIVVVGDVKTEKVLSQLEKDFSHLRRVRKNLPLPMNFKFTKKPLVTAKSKPDKQQTHIVVGFRAPKMGDADYYPFQVLNTILAGQGGRLFMKLRDEMSLAYSVTSFYAPRVESGYFGAYIGTAPHKEKSALDEILLQLGTLLKDGVAKEEVERAQRKLVGEFEIGLQRNSSQASVMGFDELYGVGWDEHGEFARKVFAVTPEDVLRVAKKYINLDSRVVSVVRGKTG